MNRIQLEHIIRAASLISDDTEIVVVGSQAIHAQDMKLPPVACNRQRPTCIHATTPNAPTTSTRPLGSFRPFTKRTATTRMAFHPRPPFFPPAGNNA
jgi:hypothetical protein